MKSSSIENTAAKLNPRQDSVTLGASATLLASIGSIIVGMLVNVIISRILGPTVKGRVDLINASASLATIVAGFSLTSGITFVVAKEQVNLRRLAGQLSGISLLQGVVIWLIMAVLSQTQFASAFIPVEYSSWGALGISALAMASLLGGYGRAFLSGMQKFVKGAVVDIGSRFLAAAATIGALIWAGKKHDQAAVLVIVLAIAVNFLISLLLIGNAIFSRTPPDSTSRFRQIWRYSIPSYYGNLIQFANYRLDIFLVAFFIGVRDVAIYGVAVSIAQLLWLPSNAMQSVLFPRISNMTDPDQKANNTAQIMRLMFLLTLFGGAVFILVAPWGISLLFGESFLPSLQPFYLLLPGVVIFCIANILCGYLAGIGKPQLNFYISLAGLITTLPLDFVLIPRIGISGAAIASSFSYTVSAGLALYFFLREAHLSVSSTLWITGDDINMAYQAFKDVLQKILSRRRV